jgi:hypothetical protein
MRCIVFMSPRAKFRGISRPPLAVDASSLPPRWGSFRVLPSPIQLLYSVFHEDPQIISVRPQRQRPAARGKSSGRGTGAVFSFHSVIKRR